jgi:Zn-dependent protease
MDTDPVRVLVNFTAIILSLTVHEFAHAKAADYMGDPTPARHGRLNLNPLTIIKAHPFGALLMPLIGAMNGFLIGWAATPVNPRLVRRQYTLRQAEFWISLAGPLSNVALALLSALTLQLTDPQLISGELGALLAPIHHLSAVMVLTNVFLALFNLIPVPPFDGFSVLASAAPRDMQGAVRFIEERANLLILFVFFFGGRLLSPMIYSLSVSIIQLSELLMSPLAALLS